MNRSIMRALCRLVLTGMLTLAGLAGSVGAATSAHAENWVATLTASTVTAQAGETVVFHATADHNVGSHGLALWEPATGVVYGSVCSYTTQCTWSVTFASAGTHVFLAYIGWIGTDGGYSNPLPVTWGSPSASVCGTSGVVVCLTTGSEIQRVNVFQATTVPGANHHIVGYVDLYRFSLPTGTVAVLPCVRLGVDASTVNPCQTSGGTFVSTTLTLTDTTVTDPDPVIGGAIASVAVCNATLQATVDGIGIESTPAYTLC